MTPVEFAYCTARRVSSRVGWLRSLDNLRSTQIAPRFLTSEWFKWYGMQKQHLASLTVLSVSTKSCLYDSHSWGAKWLCNIKAALLCVGWSTKQVKPSYYRNSTIYIPSFHLNLQTVFLQYWKHRQHPELCEYHVTCTIQRFPFQNTFDILKNFGRFLWPSFYYTQLYHNTNALDVDSSLTYLNGTKGQRPRKAEGTCYSKNAKIGYESTPVVQQGPYAWMDLGTHPWTRPDIRCLRHQGSDGMAPLSWYNLSWFSHNSLPFTILANVTVP